MNIKFLAVTALLVISLLMCTGCKEENAEQSHKVDISSETYQYRKYFHNCKFQKNFVCEMPFSAVYSDVVKDRETIFAIKGYLIRGQDGYSLYPSAESAKYGLQVESLRIQFSDALDFSVIDSYANNYIRIEGKFSDHKPSPFWHTITVNSDPVLLGEVQR